MSLIIGTDPEFFVCDKDGVILPPVWFKKKGILFPLIEDPEHKHPVYFINGDIKIIQDGAAFEVNATPSRNPEQFYQKMKLAKDTLSEFADKTGNQVIIKSAVKFNPKLFNKSHRKDEEVRQCFITGCDPDKDAFDASFEAYEFDIEKLEHRFGGGHLHLSGHPTFGQYPLPAIKLLAITCGNYYVANSKMIEEDRIRASYFGSAGKYRPQKYPDGTLGIEYRSLPNYWTVNPDMIESIFGWAEKTAAYLDDHRMGYELIQTFSEKTRLNMKEIDIDGAKNILAALP
jgi:hypothetical protein